MSSSQDIPNLRVCSIACSVIHINVQSIANKVDLLNDFFCRNKFDVFCVSEHWLNLPNLEKIKLLDYTLISAFCRSNTRHGGVAIFASNNTNFKCIDISKFCIEQHAEFCGVECRTASCAIVSVYRSSSHGNFDIFKERFNGLLDYLSAKYKYFVLTGDFNLDVMGRSEHARDLNNILVMYGSSCYITTPTRITNTTSACLDNVICNMLPEDIIAGVCDPGIADHFSVYALLKHVSRGSGSQVPILRRAFSKVNTEKFVNNISVIDWTTAAYLNTDQLSTVLLERLGMLIDKCFPYKKFNTKGTGGCWFTDELRMMRSELHRSKRAFDISGSDNDWLYYSTLRKSYKRALKDTKSNFYAHSISSSDNKNKTIWNIVKREISSASNSVTSVISALDFNVFFTSISDSIVRTIDASNACPQFFLNNMSSPTNSFYMPPILESDVRQAILKLKNTSSLDFYELNSYIIKASVDHLVMPLAILFNKCLMDGIWPNNLKISKIVPIFKKGDVDIADNYRPIAIVPIIAKIFENIIKERLTVYLDSNNIISAQQFGFRRSSSTVKALLALIDSIVDGLDGGVPTHTVLCDLTKAFDCVNVDILLLKLQHYGIRGNVANLFKSYLSNRCQFVSFNGNVSDMRNVSCGVPQGSVLGPILFLIYVNDLPSSLGDINSVLFADDATLFAKGDPSLIQEGFNRAKIWFNTNKLKLNESKTKNIIFSSDRWEDKSEPVRLLGVFLDTGLCWSAQIDSLCAKLSTQIFVMRQLRSCLSSSTMKIVYFALVHSLLSYAIVLWGNASTSFKIFRLQKSAVRIIDSAPYGTHCKPLFRKYGILPLPSLFIFESLLLTHKNLNILSSHADRHNYNTRLRWNLIPSFSRLRMTQVNKIDVSLYNKFINYHRDINVKQMTYNVFHKFAKNFFIDHCFYSVDEYLQLA